MERATALLEEMFELYDIDHSGVMNEDENLSMDMRLCEKFGVPFDEALSKRSFQETDTDMDGYVNKQEFVKHGLKKFKNYDPEELEALLTEINRVLQACASG
eukprot:TRINITY_DN53209_c0_g1_i1.p1 TRINITY_DN53209_c0_g1~~TRINITY_DN53209_c0_g1_i1.p1  ORF type:complete len:102 (-),score=29.00 TRINITY_DN53209_c0_g1_i1:67-372(-)